MKKLEVTCPNCKKKFEYYKSDSRPFCSERCRLIDLGQWLTESYTVPAEKLTESEYQNLEEKLNEKYSQEENHQEDEDF